MKFFRKIRSQLLSENRAGEYLLYAFGEIVLVVIGILIALAINNQQENKVLQQKEQVYLAGLLEEFQTSKLKLTNLIQVNQQNYLGAKEILAYCSNSVELPSEKQFSDLVFHTFSSDISFNPNNSLLIEMINSGSLKDISDDRLRVALTNWMAILEDVTRQEAELDVQRSKVLDLFRTNEYSIWTIFDQTNASTELNLPKKKNPPSNLDLFKSVAFENNLLM